MTENQEKAINTMLQEIIANTKNPKSAAKELDIQKIENLSGSMEGNISATNQLTQRLAEVIEQARKPIVSERKITINIVSREAIFIFIGMVAIIAILGSALYLSTRPDYDRADNDLKYRYIKMKGEASPARISELENLFEINRDNAKILQLRKDVEQYERLVKEQAQRIEQARLNESEAGKLNNEAESIKKKK